MTQFVKNTQLNMWITKQGELINVVVTIIVVIVKIPGSQNVPGLHMTLLQ